MSNNSRQKSVKLDAYNTGLVECCRDGPSCMDGFACAPCQLSGICNMLSHHKRDIDGLIATGLCVGDVFVLLCGASYATTLVVRHMANTYLGIEESNAACVAKGILCNPCSRCQVHRELSMRNMWPGGVCSDRAYRRKGYLVPPAPSVMGSSDGVYPGDYVGPNAPDRSAPPSQMRQMHTITRPPSSSHHLQQHQTPREVERDMYTPPAVAGTTNTSSSPVVGMYPPIAVPAHHVAPIMAGGYDAQSGHYAVYSASEGQHPTPQYSFSGMHNNDNNNNHYGAYYVGAQPAPPPAAATAPMMTTQQQQVGGPPAPVYGYVGQPPTYGRPLKHVE